MCSTYVGAPTGPATRRYYRVQLERRGVARHLREQPKVSHQAAASTFERRLQGWTLTMGINQVLRGGTVAVEARIECRGENGPVAVTQILVLRESAECWLQLLLDFDRLTIRRPARVPALLLELHNRSSPSSQTESQRLRELLDTSAGDDVIALERSFLRHLGQTMNDIAGSSRGRDSLLRQLAGQALAAIDQINTALAS